MNRKVTSLTLQNPTSRASLVQAVADVVQQTNKATKTARGHLTPIDPWPIIDHFGPRGSIRIHGTARTGRTLVAQLELYWYMYGRESVFVVQGSKTMAGNYPTARWGSMDSPWNACGLGARYTAMADRLRQRFRQYCRQMQILIRPPQRFAESDPEALIYVSRDRELVTCGVRANGAFRGNFNVYLPIGHDYYVGLTIPRGNGWSDLENHFENSPRLGREVLRMASTIVDIDALRREIPLIPPDAPAKSGRGFDL